MSTIKWFLLACCLACCLVEVDCNSSTELKPAKAKQVTDAWSTVQVYEFEGRRYLINTAGGILEIRE